VRKKQKYKRNPDNTMEKVQSVNQTPKPTRKETTDSENATKKNRNRLKIVNVTKPTRQ
jgi:hypothetical protein